MQTFSASDAKRKFGEVLSDSEYQAFKIQALQAALIEGENSDDMKNFSMETIKNQLNNN